ncbi:hypothetical protein Btru_030063 [Bulinus truncatus]|nr:hypothetical protein Btru_030063 [Bulinus truncatus]
MMIDKKQDDVILNFLCQELLSSGVLLELCAKCKKHHDLFVMLSPVIDLIPEKAEALPKLPSNSLWYG